MHASERISGLVVAAILVMFSLQAVAAAQVSGNDFDHKATGFPLNGGHATATCKSCHVGGVFKGTPKNCADCHEVGKFVGAIPKPTNHIVTDDPCEICHFNTTSFLGAHFNHGTALSGQCVTCHNGMQAIGRPASHNTGSMLVDSCDSCHRSFSWLPAGFNHVNVAGICGNCHNGTNGVVGTVNDPNGTHIPLTAGGNPNCDLCHTSTTTFTAYTMNHGGITACDTCHSSTSPYVVTTKRVLGNHQGSTAAQDCSNCHSSTASWLGAVGGTLPANHVTFTAGVPCSTCHTGTTVATGAALHAYLSQTACNSCHYTGMVVYAPNHPPQQSNHKGNVTCSSSSCHAPLGREGTAYINWGG